MDAVQEPQPLVTEELRVQHGLVLEAVMAQLLPVPNTKFRCVEVVVVAVGVLAMIPVPTPVPVAR